MSGSIPLALTQQIDVNGKPLAGALLYIFQAGTVATLQDSYQDYGLTIKNPNPLEADQYGRIPMFWLADGQIHVRLTDASGVVILDQVMQVLGPSSGGGGGGGGGGSVDPTAVFATGDWKWRPTSETLTGWVKANAQTIGSATSGATGRANADTQNLFVYLWTNFTNSKCPVTGGRGATALADFQANKTIQVPDWRGRNQTGLDDMGNTAAGIILASNVTSGGGDGPTTPAAAGGEANHVLALDEAPTGQFTFNDAEHDHEVEDSQTDFLGVSGGGLGYWVNGSTGSMRTTPSFTGCSISDHAGGLAHNNMAPFGLGSFYIKL